MKRVYCVFETCHDTYYNECDWSYAAYNYEDKFIEVYDNYQAAVLSVKDWADHHSHIVERSSGRSYEEVVFKEINPYNDDYRIHMRREIKSTLLKSS